MPEPDVRAEAIRWLGFASGDLAGAQAALERDDVPERLAAFQAQPAAEKSIRALLIVTGQNFERTHDLDALILSLPDDVALRALDVDLASLSDFAVGLRYPDAAIDVTRLQAEKAVEDARAILQSVTADFERIGQISADEITAQ